jgi:hypothetical protein
LGIKRKDLYTLIVWGRIKVDDILNKELRNTKEMFNNDIYLLMVLFCFQLKVLQQVDGGCYSPLKDLTIGGIIMVRHVKPGALEELVEPVAGLYNKCTILNLHSSVGIFILFLMSTL